ncbi:hypothetical protein N0V93_005961 [Gnomoniopsis smithogilvyi]|uniref:LysM domain-containing protein n=1 Tax=Gnomoniopsis smithogilvyi TaxID=1191159 RepID=A0A9W8YWK1_9PEZI|nr:hypothetical protein N0V93_005961 [Gnomoniopsis smithogilvyi]
MQTFLAVVVDLLVAASTASATVLLYADSLPSTLTSECTIALTVDVPACDPLVRDLRPDVFYPPASLSRICTANCSSAMETWQSSVQSGCGNQTVSADLEVEAAAVYNACLKDDSGRYCGPVAALAAAFADSGISPFNYISNTTDQVRPDDCDACLAERLRLREGSPYFDGPIVASQSLYESMTASCGIVGRPVVTTTFDYFTAAPAPTAKVCEGSTYTIQASDDCYTISKSQDVGTDWLLADNDLEAFCTNFPAAGTSLCITKLCTTVTVPTNATCEAMATAANITETQLKAWNPSISYGFANLPKMNGSEVCIDAPGRKFCPLPTPPPSLLKPPSLRRPRPPTIALADFLFLNPAMNANCTNLFALESYRVAAVGDINTYTGRPGFVSVTLDPPRPSQEPLTPSYPTLPTPRTPASTRPSPKPPAHATTACTTSTATTTTTYDVDLDAFASWNAGLGNISDPACAFVKGVRYCGSWYLEQGNQEVATATTTAGSGDDPTNTSPTPPGPTMSGSPADCNQWALVTDGLSCTDMAAQAGLTLQQWLAWNPAVSSDCLTNYWLGEAYCIGVSGESAPTTTALSGTTTKPTPPAPTMSGEPDNCNKWAVVTDGVTCTDMASQAGISLSQFLAWNPAVSSDCLTNYWLGEAYCVGISA